MDLVSWHKLARKQGSKLKLASKSSSSSRVNQIIIAQLSHISICHIDMTHSFMGNVFLAWRDTRCNIDTTNEWIRLLVWKIFSEKWLIPSNGKFIIASTVRLIADWLQAFHARSFTPQLCHTWTRAISRTHTEQEGVIAFAVLRGWNILDPRWVHALGCWFLMGWTLDSRCHYHLNAHCSGFGATFSDTWLAEYCLKLWPFHASEFTTVFSVWQSLCHVPADH